MWSAQHIVQHLNNFVIFCFDVNFLHRGCNSRFFLSVSPYARINEYIQWMSEEAVRYAGRPRRCRKAAAAAAAQHVVQLPNNYFWFYFTFVWTHISVYERNWLCFIITESFPEAWVRHWEQQRMMMMIPQYYTIYTLPARRRHDDGQQQQQQQQPAAAAAQHVVQLLLMLFYIIIITSHPSYLYFSPFLYRRCKDFQGRREIYKCFFITFT